MCGFEELAAFNNGTVKVYKGQTFWFETAEEFNVTDQYMFIKEILRLEAYCAYSSTDRRLVSKPSVLKIKTGTEHYIL